MALAKGVRPDLASIAAFIQNPNPPMPELHRAPPNDEAVQALAEHVRALQDGAFR